MGKFKHLPGDRLGPLQLKLVRRTTKPNLRSTNQYAVFECGCGAEFTARISKVQAGKAKSCGCRQYNRDTTGSLEQLIKHVKIWHAGLNKETV